MARKGGASLEQVVFAAQMKSMREDADVSLKEAAAALGSSIATVRRIEDAGSLLNTGQVTTLARRYGCPDHELDSLLEGLEAANAPAWWDRWWVVLEEWEKKVLPVETAALMIRTWNANLVPELLRTPAYSRALAERLDYESTADEKVARVELLKERQARLAERNVHIWALMGEAALNTFVGSAAIMDEQRQALRNAIENRTQRDLDITIQVVPFGQEAHDLSSSAPLCAYRVAMTGVQDHVVLEKPGSDAEVINDRKIVSELREHLDRAVVYAPMPDTPLPSPLPRPSTT